MAYSSSTIARPVARRTAPQSPSIQEKPYRFHCDECTHELFLEENEDPTSSHGACRVCGGSRWSIYDRATQQRIA